MKFEFNTVGRAVFGRGEVERVGEIAAALGRRAMVVFNGKAVEKVVASLEAAGVNVVARRQPGEPVVADVDAAVQETRRAGCDLVVGVGGGSAIDAAKAVAGLLTNGGSAVDYMEVVGAGRKITKPAVPWVAVPTTAGTGAEATRNAVIGLPEKKFKASIRGEQLLAHVAVIDPDLGAYVPPDVTARTGMDALCQLIESYTSTGANVVTDGMALEGIALAGKALPRAYRDGRDIEAREDMAAAAYLSGVTLANAGLGAVHGFASPIGANFPVPHGTVCAALLPHVIAANVNAAKREGNARVRDRYAIVGERLGGDVVEVTAGLARELNIPPLSEYGMSVRDVPDMVALARKASSMRYNPLVLSDEALASALAAAIR